MKLVLFAMVLALAPLAAPALPAEDHWSSPLDPEDAAALAKAQEMIDDWDYGGALEVLKPLSAKLIANADVYNLLGYAYRKTGALSQSGLAYDRALYLNPNHLGALEYQGELHLKRGDPEAAEANLAKLKTLCASPCEELDELAAAIGEWRAKHAE